MAGKEKEALVAVAGGEVTRGCQPSSVTRRELNKLKLASLPSCVLFCNPNHTSSPQMNMEHEIKMLKVHSGLCHNRLLGL